MWLVTLTNTATFAAVHNELSTLPFLAPRRLVVVENAEPFVQEYRQRGSDLAA